MNQMLRVVTWWPRKAWAQALVAIALTLVITLIVSALVLHDPPAKAAPGRPVPAELMLSSAPHGSAYGCGRPSFYNTQTCTLKFQRGNVDDMLAYIKGAEGQAVGLVTAVSVAICVLGRLGLAAAICGAVGAFLAARFIQTLKDAQAAKRCAQVKWTQLWQTPYGSVPLIPSFSFQTLEAKDQVRKAVLVQVAPGRWDWVWRYVWPTWCQGNRLIPAEVV